FAGPDRRCRGLRHRCARGYDDQRVHGGACRPAVVAMERPESRHRMQRRASCAFRGRGAPIEHIREASSHVDAMMCGLERPPPLPCRTTGTTRAFPVKKGSPPMLYVFVFTQFRTQNRFALLREMI